MKKYEFIVRAKRASKNDPDKSVTYRTSEFPSDFYFENGKKYLLKLDTGDLILVKASRNGTTLYSGRITNPLFMAVPEYTGDSVPHRIVGVSEVVDI